jgi:hypothetical protein
VASSKWLPAVLALAVLLAGASACGDDDRDGAPSLDDPGATAAELVDEYFTLLSAGDGSGLEELLSDAFVVQRADGSTATKDEYLTDLPEIERFEVSDLLARQDGDALVVRYEQTVQETIGGERLRTDPAPRLSTFVWADGRWRLSSHANFNVP